MLANPADLKLLKRVKARGRVRTHKPGEMNKLEAEYAEHLATLFQDDVIVWHKFEAITFKLAKDTRFTPDFVVMKHDGTIELHEVKPRTGNATKGYKPWIEEDAWLKVKLAAELFPFELFIVWPGIDGHWNKDAVGC